MDARATVTPPPTDMFWADRFAAIVDPSGHAWEIATRKEDVSSEEMAKGMQAQV